MESNEGNSQWRLEQEDLERLMQLHGYDNKEEINRSEQCLCVSCQSWFGPGEITFWYEDRHAVCPNPDCRLAGVVIGSASGLDLKRLLG